MTKLSVNLNKVALLRNQRDLAYPSVIEAAETCIAAGCHGITVHPRPDERHIRKSDVFELAEMLPVEFNIEGNPHHEFMDLIRTVQPAQCTLVPDAPDQSTSDHGWDLAKDGYWLTEIINELVDLGIRVSLFIDPIEDEVSRAKDIGADRVELYTEPYASAFARGDGEPASGPYKKCAEAAHLFGLGVNAGHDLSLDNLDMFLQKVPHVVEVSIGHALIADAVFIGLKEAVKRYISILALYSGEALPEY